VIDGMLKQIDEMFAFNAGFGLFDSHESTSSTNVSNPATKFFVDCLIQNWAQEPFFKGGYSHPAPTASEEVRSNLAATISNRLFFAGEATHPKAYMTLHGAIETGDFAAKEVLESLAKDSFTPIASSKL